MMNARSSHGRLVRPTLGEGGSPAPPRSQWLAAWLPWQHAIVPPATHAFTIPSGADLIVDLYYRGGDEPIVDRPSLSFMSSDTARGGIEDIVIDAAPAPAHSTSSVHRLRGERRLRESATLWAIQPRADAPVQSLELRATRPDGTIEVLFWMPQVRHDWPHALVLQERMPLPGGTVITMSASSSEALATSRVTLTVLR